MVEGEGVQLEGPIPLGVGQAEASSQVEGLKVGDPISQVEVQVVVQVVAASQVVASLEVVEEEEVVRAEILSEGVVQKVLTLG